MTTTNPAAQAAADATSDLLYRVEGMSCSHCESAVTAEVGRVPGVAAVEVDLAGKLVRVRGTEVEDAAVRAAIDEAGYDAVRA
jgi:copper chaperone CopZ